MHVCMQAVTYAQMAGQTKDIMPPAPVSDVGTKLDTANPNPYTRVYTSHSTKASCFIEIIIDLSKPGMLHHHSLWPKGQI